jgi:Protein of unknown function (DUF1559)
MRSPADRHGLTVIELMVVIACIALLLALMLPAVQYSREAARRTTCQNQLRQIAMAMHAHEGAHRHLPTGGWGWRWTGEPDRGFAESQPGGWVYNLMPFMELEDRHNIGLAELHPARAQALSANAAMPIVGFNCPSRRSATPLSFVHPVDFVNMDRPTTVARSDYAACSGDTAPDPSGGRGRGPVSQAEGDSPAFVWVETDRNGCIFRRSRITFGEIRDGLSNTYLVGEKYVARRDYGTGMAQNDDQHLFVGYDSDTLRTTDPNYPVLSDGADVTSDHSFGSNHANGCYMALVDASIHFVSQNVNLRIHQTRGNRYDGGLDAFLP